MRIADRFAMVVATFILGATGCLSARAEDGVYVAPTFVSAPIDSRVGVPAGQVRMTDLGQLREGSRALIQIESENRAFPDITALVMDKASVQAYMAGQRVWANGAERRSPPFRIQFTAPADGEFVLVLDNRYSMVMTKQVRTRIAVEHKMNSAEVQGMTSAIKALVAQIRARYDVPDFDVKVQPCGQVNAFSQRSNGAITLCTEMIAKTIRSPGALIGIVYHEVGHSVLNLWGLPGHDNEDTADEFAVQLALRYPRDAQVIEQFAAFFESGDPWLEARSVIERGDRHTIGVQRARNIRTFLKTSKELTARWNMLTYQRMTTEALTAITRSPGPYESADLASQVLASRQSGSANAPAAIAAQGASRADGPPFGDHPERVLDEKQLRPPAGAQMSVNYGGRYNIQVHSCGTGCRYYSMRDLADGRDLLWLDRFAATDQRPKTKEGFPYLTILHSRPDSSLLVAQFEVSMPSGETECWEQHFVPATYALRATGPVVKRCSKLDG